MVALGTGDHSLLCGNTTSWLFTSSANNLHDTLNLSTISEAYNTEEEERSLNPQPKFSS